MTKREFLDTVFALAPNEANAIMDAFDEYVESNVAPTGRGGKERRMSKYIIEIPDDVQYVLLNGKADGKYYTAVRPVAVLEMLNSDYINENFGELQDEAYQAGLNDAWEAAKKLFSSMADSDIEKAFPIEWNNGGFKALMNLQPQEAIAKLKAYEDKRSDRIEVGDEVRFLPNDRKGIVTACHVPDVYAENDKYAVFCGTTVEYVLRQHITKTGKHYDIASILEAMRK